MQSNVTDELSVLDLVERIAKPFESCSLTSYRDCAGFPTNGWGNLLMRKRLQAILKENDWTRAQADMWLHEKWPPISQEQADADFRINLNKAFCSVMRLVKIPLSNKQLAALTDFAFNCGAGNLQISTLLRLVNRGEFAQAADEFGKWNKAGGIVYRGLTKRRRAECNLFKSSG